jgi:hypothetical protein
MKIKHVLPADGLVAQYIHDHEPYGTVAPCVHQALVERKNEDPEPEFENVSEIVGFVIDRYIVPADEVSEGTRFIGYIRATYNADQWKEHIESLKVMGRRWAAENAPIPPTVEKIFNDEERPRKRRK